MKLNLLIASLFSSVALVACGDSSPSDSSSTSTVAPAPTVESTSSSDVASTTTADMPPICAEYFAAVDEFVAKYPEIANPYQEEVATTKKQIEEASVDEKDSFAAGCQAAYDAFKQAVADMPQQ